MDEKSRTSDAQRRACRRYYEKTKAEKRVYMLRFSKTADADVIAELDAAANKTAYIRELIREKNRKA